MKRTLTLGWLLFFCVATSLANERITSFSSTIHVEEDGRLTVHESIAVTSYGWRIKHGIMREFPTRYHNFWGICHTVPFKLIAVTLNGKPTGYSIEQASNGIRLYIGDARTYLPPNHYVFDLIYQTDMQLGFFNDHDELYWNVTGNGWKFQIDKARATVMLPQGATIRSAEGYTGDQGSKEQNYQTVIHENTASYQTTSRLEQHQGLTIVVTWNKGIIAAPSWYAVWKQFFMDNVYLMLTILGLILLLGMLMYCLLERLRMNKPGTIIPRFYPPQDYTPSAVGFMYHMGFKNSFIAADIVNLAVKGYINIAYDAKTTIYTLTKRKNEHETLSIYEQDIMSALFALGDTFQIQQAHHDVLNKIKTISEFQVTKDLVYSNLKDTSAVINAGYSIGVATILIFFSIFYEQSWQPLHLIIFVLNTGIAYLIGCLYKVYTRQGRMVQDEIDGFRWYLLTAEAERLKTVGTPPIKTPELYEKYLPYAMVLGVEEAWQKQFVPVFERLKEAGTPYVPAWHTGDYFFVHNFSRNINRYNATNFMQSIASSTTTPGSSSGSRGGGSSGGGGGGGGGGGW